MLKLLKTIASTGLILLGLSTAAMAATPKDVLVVAQIAEPKSMDPATVTAVNDFRILMNVYDGLVRYKDRIQISFQGQTKKDADFLGERLRANKIRF